MSGAPEPEIKVMSAAFWAMMGLALASLLGALALFAAIHQKPTHDPPRPSVPIRNTTPGLGARSKGG